MMDSTAAGSVVSTVDSTAIGKPTVSWCSNGLGKHPGPFDIQYSAAQLMNCIVWPWGSTEVGHRHPDIAPAMPVKNRHSPRLTA
ncbi:MAG TPA: hypothetical protein VHV26_07685 [Rhizomicrobium sp.]|nr:hypothetical protein [Rhizomicrobium sp.]